MGGRVSGESAWRRYRRVVLVDSPAAGADWTVTVPGGKVWDIVSILARLATSSTVANRAAVLEVTNGTTTYLKVPPQGVQAASLTYDYAWWRDAPAYAAGTGLVAPIPRLFIPAGYVLKTATANIDTTDAWTGIVLDVVETMVTAGPIDVTELPEMVVELAGGAMGGGPGS